MTRTHRSLKASFDDPADGWVGLTISRGDEAVTINASYTPRDSFRELADALYKLFLHEGEAKVVWNEGPGEDEMRFSREGDFVRLEVCGHPGRSREEGRGERLFEASGSYGEVCVPFWRALRSLQGRFTGEELSARWHRPFPSEEVDGLTALLRAGR
jgi:hypothetical protein